MPSRPVERILDKLAEARFFYARFSPCGDVEKAQFYFSAFLSAARSVSFTVQAVCKPMPGFDQWYATEQAVLRASAVSKYLLGLRNETQKVGLAPVHYRGVKTRMSRSGRFHCQLIYRLVALDDGHQPPVDDARAAAAEYLSLLGAVVGRCYDQFRATLDPDGRLRGGVTALSKLPLARTPVCPLDNNRHNPAGRKYLVEGEALMRRQGGVARKRA